MRLWPIINYQSDSSHRHLKLFGPLIEYESGTDGTTLIVRPFFQLTSNARQAETMFTLLYPLLVWRTDDTDLNVRIFNLISYSASARSNADATRTSFTVFPFVFYRRDDAGPSLSVLPFYANLENRFSYDRIRMIAFPLYLQLEDDLVQQTWLPFPFVWWSGGTLGRGGGFWPFYGWEEKGLAQRSQYVCWPFYVSQEEHFTRPEREERLLLYPFYARITSPTRETHAYGWPLIFPFLSHTVDQGQKTEAWGFPWPFWLTQRNVITGELTALRLTPFYQDTQYGDVHSHFLLWPLYRWETQASDTFVHTRSDVLMVLYRDIRDEQPESRHVRTLQTMFPFYRRSSKETVHDLATLALLDAIIPQNETIASLYAPLWQVYTRAQDGAQPAQWSVLWDLISSDGTRLRYPVAVELAP